MDDFMTSPEHPSHDCSQCLAYADRRIKVLAVEVVNVARQRGVSARDVLTRFMRGVHDRHERGLSLNP